MNQSLPVVGIYFSEPNKTDYPLNKPKFREAYYELMQELLVQHVQPVIVRGADSYTGKGAFTHAWIAGATSDPQDYIQIGPVEVTMLFNRGRLKIDAEFIDATINHPSLDYLEDDKAASQIILSRYLPEGCVIQPGTFTGELPITGSRIVSKYQQTRGGAGVFIEDRSSAIARIASDPERTWTVQRYIDTSGGAPGIIDCEHDIRVIILNGEIVGCVVRPRDLWLRGKYDPMVIRSFMLAVQKIPSAITRIVQEIDELFAGKHRYYCIDFAYERGRWYVIEMNSTPGLIPSNRGPLAVHVQKKLASYLCKAVAAPVPVSS